MGKMAFQELANRGYRLITFAGAECADLRALEIKQQGFLEAFQEDTTDRIQLNPLPKLELRSPFAAGPH